MLGERLEEARKRKGVTIREAAEATKIRGDYLLAMEDNSFTIALPQIYIRGFLKNYARFLQMDTTKILTDYDAHLLGRNPPPTTTILDRGNQESLGRVEIPSDNEAPEAPVIVTEGPEDDGPDPDLRFSLDRQKETRSAPPPPTLEREGTTHDQESWNENKTLYIKIGIVFAAILVVATILIVMIRLLTGDSDTPAINPELAVSSMVAEPVRAEPALTQAQSGSELILVTASDNVTLIIEQTIDRKRLYSGTLNAGESLSLEKEGPVSIRFTNGSAVIIEKDGQRLSPSQTGVGRTVVE